MGCTKDTFASSYVAMACMHAVSKGAGEVAAHACRRAVK